MSMKNRVLMAMSGGIDSTVSAMLLLDQGYELVGCTYRTYDSMKDSCIANEKGCCTIDSIMEAKHNAKILGFEHHIVDFRDVFKNTVIKNFIEEYSIGRTPNPCIMCNSSIKWGVLWELAKQYNCDYIATGHYAQIENVNGTYCLKNAIDTRKDQTYFLWKLTSEDLSHTLFPLGGLTKDQVRQIAKDKGFVKLSEKTESQDICFVPGGDYRKFLSDNGVIGSSGFFTDIYGNIVGSHPGFVNYTVGQRRGLGIALGYPAYVTSIDAKNNIVRLGSFDDLFQNDVQLESIETKYPIQYGEQVKAKIRYNSILMDCIVKDNWVRFDKPVWGVTPGQSCVIYKDGLVIGGGIIK